MAGRSASADGVASRGQVESESLVKEVERLRKRARQQEEALARMGSALKALRRAGQALHAENRELRLAVQKAQREPHEASFL